MDKNLNSGFGLIGVLLIIGALLLTVGGVVVWEKKVSPSPTPLLTQGPDLECTRDIDCLRNCPTDCPGGSSECCGQVQCQSGRCVYFPPTVSKKTPREDGEQVSLGVEKNSYTRGEKMVIIVKNHRQDPIAASNHKYACQIVSLEQLVGAQWQVLTDTCGSAAVTRTVVLEAGEEKVLTLPTSAAGGLLAYELTAGTYRLRFDYVAGREAIFTPDQTKEIKTVYSAQFQIL